MTVAEDLSLFWTRLNQWFDKQVNLKRYILSSLNLRAMVSMAERAIEFAFYKYVFIIIFDHISLDTLSASSLSTTIKADGFTISSIEINFA